MRVLESGFTGLLDFRKAWLWTSGLAPLSLTLFYPASNKKSLLTQKSLNTNPRHNPFGKFATNFVAA